MKLKIGFHPPFDSVPFRSARDAISSGAIFQIIEWRNFLLHWARTPCSHSALHLHSRFQRKKQKVFAFRQVWMWYYRNSPPFGEASMCDTVKWCRNELLRSGLSSGAHPVVSVIFHRHLFAVNILCVQHLVMTLSINHRPLFTLHRSPFGWNIRIHFDDLKCVAVNLAQFAQFAHIFP